jgi:OOP family OmpA-OmpF porin
MSDTLLPPGAITTGIDRNTQDTSYKLFGGYQMNRVFGVEAGYFDLGKFAFTTTTTTAGVPPVPGRLHSEKKVQGFNLDLVGTLPFTPSFALLGRIGVQNAKASSDFTSSGSALIASPGSGKRETNYKFGAGLQVTFSPAVMLRGDAERYRVNDGVSGHGNINVFSLSVVFPFGRGAGGNRQMSSRPQITPALYHPDDAPAAQPVVNVEPAVAAPMDAPAPMVQQDSAPAPMAVSPVAMEPSPPAAVPQQRVTYSAESLFGFDKSEVQPEGRRALDTFARELEGTQYDAITVEGHADRLGTEAHNQTLSQQRADAVKSYLVETGKVDAGKITTVGKSESEPVTKAEDCKGSTPNAKLIACLQADRRVEIGVSGTR